MPEATARRALMLVLCYLSVLAIIPLLTELKDREIRWHARNGLLIFAGVVAVGVVATILGSLLPGLGCLYGVLMLVMLVVYTLVVILAIVKALQGERLIVPVFSRHAG